MTSPSILPPPFARAWFIVLFGVILPIVAILTELTQHLCAEAFFDPIPTIGHVFAVAAVPGANLLALRILWHGGARLEAHIFASAFAVAVAGVYALIFAPLTPLALIAIPLGGLGLLALSPLLALIASLLALGRLRRLRAPTTGRPRRTALGGLGAGLGILVALQIPVAATRLLLAAAASDDAAVSRRGVSWLRRLGQRDLMLRACYQTPSGATDVVSALVNVADPVPPAKVREIYYRVTGRPFDTEPRPRLGRAGADGARDWDVVQGGDEVGVVALRGLALASSRFDGSVDGRAATAYVEWTFELRNDAPIAREARAELALPPGGVVSRVTLWIDGVEREAAFGARDVTRRAYQRVVRAQRDPILVTTTAPDRVLVQCFPVPPAGGVMKARIGITAPLQLQGRGAAVLGLPYITQRNFAIPATVAHAVWIASKDPFLTPRAPLQRVRADDGAAVRGVVAEPARPGPFAAITFQRPAGAVTTWAADRADRQASTPDAIIQQTLRPAPRPLPSRLAIVIDGSAALQTGRAAIETALRSLPAGIPVALLVAGDETQDLLGGAVTDGPEHAKVRAGLSGVRFAGGTDAAPALAAAWDLAAAAPGGAVLWIHGPQPVLLASPEELRQRVERRSDAPPVYTYAAVAGENRLLAALADLPALEVVPRFTPGGEAADLERFLRQLGGTGERIVATRTREAGARATPATGGQTSDHLARLWARDRVDALARGLPGSPPRPAEREEAMALAGRYRLVTAVSGAVVLQTQAETERAGLEPSDPGQVPTVPEPETWALLALVAVVLIAAVVVRRRARGGAVHAA